MPMTRSHALWAVATLLSTLLLIAPALWNGFPLLEYDTGGYLARWYEGTLLINRPLLYGLLLTANVPFAFWPVIVFQSLLTIWIVAVVLRTHGYGGRPMLVFGIIAVLSVVSTLPWITAILLTDIYAGLAILAFYMLLARSDQLTRFECWTFVVLIACACATHSATLAVMLLLSAASIVLTVFDRTRLPRMRVAQGVLAVVLGIVIVIGTNFMLVKRFAWTPGGFSMYFGRMLQAGIVPKYLDKHCPDATIKLCAIKDRLPDNADDWFWANKDFDKLGRFAGMSAEMERVAVGSVADFPLDVLRTTIIATAEQLVAVRTGEGVVNWIWHTYFIVKDWAPQLQPAMWAARQQKGEISFTAINALHYPVALVSMAFLPVILIMGWTGRLPRAFGDLAFVCILALLANAFVCGGLANPHDRYGARIVWLAVFVAGLALLRLYQQREGSAAPTVARDILAT
ncbi:hypothetical protein [Undibacter mobilis]|uniref:Dolichyl-phosphate-mannose-protein mannosyltransferase n=1 Tax=Undibacter mobilis TaxID=2292256 RepID=A0A371BC26_9BRAD|nr:hypothetical protein [Undibacter mobilis]RDV05159.1 hypothetical protein DXH78_11640 [Undibacter mobilis]